jgi:hypothetical protein
MQRLSIMTAMINPYQKGGKIAQYSRKLLEVIFK